MLFLLHFGVIIAQYDVSWSLIPSSSPPKYTCTIVPNPSTTTTDFAKQDLITWIFPDGQFLQQEIQPDKTTGVITNSSTTIWQPYTSTSNGEVVAYVAKKGQPGTPPKRAAPTSSSLITGNFNSSPAPFAMPATARWQVNRTWEFAPGYENFLILSYRIGDVCDAATQPNKIKLTYDPKEINLVKTTPSENFTYQNESLTGPTTINSVPPQHEVEVTNFKYNTNPVINHVYLKFKLEKGVSIGKTVKIAIVGSICDEPIDDTLRYIAKGTPHDPNEKIVNNPIICSAKPGPIDLNYYIKFQNDGTAAVDDVDIEDVLPTELDVSTWSLNRIPNSGSILNGLGTVGNKFFLKFRQLGLPGLNQTTPYHYAYDQTCFDFKFDICTYPNLATQANGSPRIFSNSADIYFYDNSGKLPVVTTNQSNVMIRTDTCYKGSGICVVPTIEQSSFINRLQITPNPIGEEVNIFIELTEKTHLIAIVRDLNGRIIAEVANRGYLSGVHQLYWNSAKVHNGIYLLDIHTEQGRITRKIIKI